MQLAPVPPGRRRTQQGAAAIEFALVMSLFLLVLYFVMSYGAIFVAQQTLERAASEAARVMVAAQSNALTATPGVPGAPSALTPEQLGVATATQAVQWLSTFRQSQQQAPITPQIAQSATCAANMACRTITVTYPAYADHPLVPRLVPGLPMPSVLSASATVQLDPVLWKRAGGAI